MEEFSNPVEFVEQNFLLFDFSYLIFPKFLEVCDDRTLINIIQDQTAQGEVCSYSSRNPYLRCLMWMYYFWMSGSCFILTYIYSIIFRSSPFVFLTFQCPFSQVSRAQCLLTSFNDTTYKIVRWLRGSKEYILLGRIGIRSISPI